MRQGAVGSVRLVEQGGRHLVEKRFADRRRLATEVVALRALAGGDLPVPEVVRLDDDALLMTRLPGERPDALDPDPRLQALVGSMGLLRHLHGLAPPAGLPPAPDDAAIVRRYRAAGGPPLPFTRLPGAPPSFCHGDWTDANLLVVQGRTTGVVDWEAAHVGDPLRDLSRAAWGAARKDPRVLGAMVAAYGADPAAVEAWLPVHAAELWLWFAEAGPPAYLEHLTVELRAWPA